MTAFDNEYMVLLKWYIEHLGAAKNLPDEGEGFDGCSERSLQEMKIDKEYRQKLLALEQKYKAPPITKAQTFGQVLQPTGT